MFCKVPHLSGNLNSKRRVKCPKLKHLRLTGQGYFVLVLIIMMLIDKRSILQLPYCYLFLLDLIIVIFYNCQKKITELKTCIKSFGSLLNPPLSQRTWMQNWMYSTIREIASTNCMFYVVIPTALYLSYVVYCII